MNGRAPNETPAKAIVAVRPNVAMSAAASAFLPLIMILLGLFSGSEYDTVALAGAITTIIQFTVQYFAPAYAKTPYAALAAPASVLVSGLAAHLLAAPYDQAAIAAAASSIVAVLFAAIFPNSTRR